VNIIEKTDKEILATAEPLWRDLVKNSNDGKYEEFVAAVTLLGGETKLN
jgi:hypothetical protein